MFIMQYQITLPADYDMRIIRSRVANKGASFDTFTGLGLKCFLIREKGKFGAQANQYSPVYLWPQVDAMWGFLAGPAFGGIKGIVWRAAGRDLALFGFCPNGKARPSNGYRIGYA